jgi:peroxiredoxin
MLAEGAKAPDLTIGDPTVGEWSLAAALKNGPVLLAFFKIACPTCQLTMPFLDRLAAAAQVVAISQDDRTGTNQFRKRFKVGTPAILDAAPAYTASNLYGIRNVPSLFLVEPDGKISMAETGFSKAHLEELGERFGVPVFKAGEDIPVFRPG